MKPISEITSAAMKEITKGQFVKLPRLSITGLLNDFQYSWLHRFQIPYKFEMLDIARSLCNGENKATFRATHCKSIEDIRKAFDVYINKWHKDDDRVILSLSFDGKKINSEWVKLKEYLEATKTNSADS